MIAIELYVNDQKISTASLENGVMSAIVNWIKLQEEDDSWHAGISLAGLDNKTSEHVRWVQQDLGVGDEVRIRLVETDTVDAPVARELKQE